MRFWKSKPPPVEEGSFSCTPSINTTVWSLSAPRMKTDVGWPTPPLRARVMPGVRTSRSAMPADCDSWIAAASITVTELPTLERGSGARLATTTTSSRPSSVVAAAVVSACAMGPARQAARTPSFKSRRCFKRVAPWSTSSNRVHAQAHTARPDGHEDAGLRSNAALFRRHTGYSVRAAHPGCRMGDQNKQVSWLVARGPGITFPDLVDPVVFDAGHTTYSCGGSPGVTPVFPLNPPEGNLLSARTVPELSR